MTIFHLDVSHVRPFVAVVAAHGLTDLDSHEWVAPYIVWGLAPLHGTLLTTLFCAASTVHFAEDYGPRTSGVVHAAAAAIAATCGLDVAFQAMIVYLALVHTPAHYARCYRRGRTRGLALAAIGTAAALAAMPLVPDTLVVDHWVQRIVIAHICHEYKLARF